MKMQNVTGWNDEVVKRRTKEELVNEHPHLLKNEVEAKWDEVHGKTETKVKAKSKDEVKADL